MSPDMACGPLGTGQEPCPNGFSHTLSLTGILATGWVFLLPGKLWRLELTLASWSGKPVLHQPGSCLGQLRPPVP